MMSRYYVSKKPQPSGDHEIHIAGCLYLPAEEDRIYLGNFHSSGDLHGSGGVHSCRLAVEEAKKHYSQVNGCYYCSSECYTP